MIILGELHGAKVNLKVISDFVRRLEIRTVMVELEAKWRKALDSLSQNTLQSCVRKLKKEHWLRESGLISKAHLRLFSQYRRRGIKIIPIKVEDRVWNNAEKKTAHAINEALKKYSNHTALLVVGNLHARKVPFRLRNDRRKYVPLGSHLGLRALSILVRYGSGKIYNFGEMTVRDNYALQHLKDKKTMFIPSRSKYFDYEYLLAHTEPMQLL